MLRLLENIVARPPLATVVVGGSILLLQLLLQRLVFPARPSWTFLYYLVPFIPPFLVTSIARRINQRQAVYHFMEDAAVLMVVAFPEAPTVEALLQMRPALISKSCNALLGFEADALQSRPFLHPDRFMDQSLPLKLAAELIESFKRNGRGVVQSFPVGLRHADGHHVRFLMSCVLAVRGGRLKWQATLQPLPEASGGRSGFETACIKHVQHQRGRP